MRRKAGWTQLELAEKLGLKRRGAVANWEGGVREPRNKQFRGLAELAEKMGDIQLKGFFLDQIEWRRLLARQKNRAAQVNADLLAELLKTEGDALQSRLRALSRMTDAELSEYRRMRASEAYASESAKPIKGGPHAGMSASFLRILQTETEISAAKALRGDAGARKSKAGTRKAQNPARKG